MNNFPVIKHFLKFHRFVKKNVVWPYSPYEDSLYSWRANVLAAVLTTSLIFGIITYFLSLKFLIHKELWTLLIFDTTAFFGCLILICVKKIRFEVRATITLLGFFIIGSLIIYHAGVLSGGPAWLFAFPVLTGIILGRKAVIAALLMNSVFFIITGIMIYVGIGKNILPVSANIPKIVTVIANFIMLNSITAISVSFIVKGVFSVYKTKEELADDLKRKQVELIEKKESLESEIVERKIAEKEIWKLNQFRNSIIENANIWISAINLHGDVLAWNKACESICGYSKDEVVGNRKIWRKIYPDKEYRKKIILKIVSVLEENKILNDYENTIIRRDGKTSIISWYVRSLFDDNGVKMGAIAIGRDVTKQAQAEEEMRDAKKIAGENTELALVGQVAGKLAHDFNNVLGIIMGNTELSLVSCKDEKIRKTLELILDQTLKGRNLTRNLVAFAKSQEPKQIFFKISDKIDLVLSLLKKDLERIKIKREDQKDIPDLMADPGMIEHALVNIIQNSIHATSMESEPEISIKTFVNDEKIHIEIIDNGCGIPKEHIEDIYIPSFTLKGGHDLRGVYARKIKGTGYGMSNVKKYVTQHKGKINLETEEGKYTKFTISLPVIKKELTAEEKKELEEILIQSEKRILLVEDEPSISNVLRKILSSPPFNHYVDVAVSGVGAIEMFEAGNYDLASLDYLLSGELNGMDVYNHIREENKNIPVLFLSGNIEFLESIRDLKKKDKYLEHLSKPCKNRDYVDAVNRLINKN